MDRSRSPFVGILGFPVLFFGICLAVLDYDAETSH